LLDWSETHTYINERHIKHTHTRLSNVCSLHI